MIADAIPDLSGNQPTGKRLCELTEIAYERDQANALQKMPELFKEWQNQKLHACEGLEPNRIRRGCL
jgi:hypothetical protein